MNQHNPATRPVYPFTALVGQEHMRTALLLHAIHPGLGGVLISGEKGTAKSTAVRALAGLLPDMDAVAGCPFGCDPAAPAEACDDCATLLTTPEPVSVLRRPVPLVELPIGATEDRVLGSLNLEAAIQSGERRFEPGLLARANRGILYVDEVNLLADHLVDVLLDAAAMGRNYVEREAISYSHPASFMLIGTMNPEEGDLRPQLLDRFALMVTVESLRQPAERAEAVRRRIAFERNPAGFVSEWAPCEMEERRRIIRARAALPAVRVTAEMLDLIVRICAEFAVDGLRADLAIYRAATALASYNHRDEVDRADIRLAAELALAHRRRRQPFEDPGLDQQQLDRLISEDAEAGAGGPPPENGHGVDGLVGGGDSETAPPERLRQPAGTPAAQGSGSSAVQPSRIPAPPSLALPALHALHAPRKARSGNGRRASRRDDRRGPPVSTAIPGNREFELAVAATLRAAATSQPRRRASAPGPAIRVLPADLRMRVRKGRTSAFAVFAVDASGSMGAANRIAFAKSAVMGLLLDAYRKRDRVALVAFRGSGAELLLPPTNSVTLAERRLRSLPAGGKTPLAAGLRLAADLFDRSRLQPERRLPLLVLVSDGKANSADPPGHPWRAALAQAERLRQSGVTSVFLDTEKGHAGAGLGRALAQALGGQHVALHSIAAGRQPGVDA